MAKSAFRLALEDAINQRHSAVHPWSDAWTSGKLDRRLLGEWVKQHYHYVSHFSEWLGTVYANCPHWEVQHFLLENMTEEEGFVGSADFKPVRHSELLLEFAETCGMNEVRSPRCADRTANSCPRRWDCKAGVTASRCARSSRHCRGLLVGLESQVPVIYSKTTPPLLEKYGFTEDEVTFFTLHIVADQEHGDRGYEIVEKYASTPEQQKVCVGLVREAAMMRRLYLDGLHRKFLAGGQVEQRKRVRGVPE